MTPARVLMLRPLGLGDLLTIVPAMRAVSRAFPKHARWLAAAAPLSSLARLSGVVDRVVPARPLRRLPSDCDDSDLAIDFHGRGPGSHRVLLATRPRRLIAFANREVRETRGFPPWRDDEHEVARWCRLLSENGIPADPADLDIDPPRIQPPPVAYGATVIHPGAAYPARRWPVDRWVAVAQSLRRRIVITGSPAERPMARAIADAAGLPREHVLAGRTDPLTLAAVIAAARLVICADTGVAHLATALRTPSVVLFGPSSPARWGPPPERPWHRVIWKGREGDPNGTRPDPGLMAISVADVLHAVEAASDVPYVLRA